MGPLLLENHVLHPRDDCIGVMGGMIIQSPSNSIVWAQTILTMLLQIQNPLTIINWNK